MNQRSYQNLISSQNRSFLAGLLYIVLIMISKVYSVIIRLRNYFYDKHILAIHHTKAVVISIGNITAGGTGKTPLVIWLCNEITKDQSSKTKDYRLAILTRGYKTTQSSKLKTQNYIDEPEVLAENCPNTKVIINPDRVVGASQAIGKYPGRSLKGTCKLTQTYRRYRHYTK